MACKPTNNNQTAHESEFAFQDGDVGLKRSAGLKQVESSERADDCVSDRNNPSYTSETNPCKSAPLMLSTPESIHNNAQQLVESLNNKRKQDAEIISNFKKALEMQIEKTVSAVEQNLLLIYEHQSERIQIVLNELFATLDRVAAIEAELSQFKQVMSSMCEQLKGPD